MNSSEFRAWLSGLLEGLACREIDLRLMDTIMRKVEAYRGEPATQHATYPAPAQAVYEEADEPPPTPQPKTLKEALAATKKHPVRKKEAPQGPLENSTPVAAAPAYNPDDPQVVRIG